MSKILIINSKDRVNYQTTNSGSFKINFDQPLYDQTKLTRCDIVGVCIPKGYFNINTNNKTFTIDMQGDNIYSFTLTEKFYTITSLCAALQIGLNAFDAAYNNFTVTYSSSNQDVTIAKPINNFKVVNSELAKLLGLYDCASKSYGTAHLSNGSLQFLSQPVFFYLDIQQLEKNIHNSNNRCLSTFLIPIVHASPSTIDMESNIYINDVELNSLNCPVRIKDPRFTSFSITLYDSNLNVVDLKHSDWVIYLKFTQ